jgi:hypothetical protein
MMSGFSISFPLATTRGTLWTGQCLLIDSQSQGVTTFIAVLRRCSSTIPITWQVPGGDKGLGSLTIYTNHIKIKRCCEKTQPMLVPCRYHTMAIIQILLQESIEWNSTLNDDAMK